MESHLGFIGIGTMGYGMAMNVRRKMDKKSTLFINDVNRSACEKFAQEFAAEGEIVIVDTAREVAEKADVIISIVPTSQHVRAVYLDSENGVIAGKANGKRLLLECSTIDSQTTRDVGETLQKVSTDMTYIDTPVSGGAPGAAAGTLSFMIGRAEPDDSDEISKLLIETISMMGSPEKFLFCGRLGAGLTAKITNNYLAGVNLLAIAEAMAFGIRSGVDKHILYKVIKNSSGQSWMCDHVNPVPGVLPNVPSSRDYQGGFKAQMMVKDMSLGVDAGKAMGVRTTTGLAALEVYKESAVDPRCVDRDVSVVYRFLDGPE